MAQAYSLWLVPDEDSRAHQVLDDRISENARTFEDAPDFRPHVTLLGMVSGEAETIRDRAVELTSEFATPVVEFTGVSCSTTTYQCVFLLAEPSLELLTLRRAAVETFGQSGGMYVPHLSLVYSDMSIEERTEAVRSTDFSALPDRVSMPTLDIVDTDGPVERWESVASLTF